MTPHNLLKLAPIFGLGLALSLASPAVAQQSQDNNMPGYPVGNPPQSTAPPDNNSTQNPSYNPDANPAPPPPAAGMPQASRQQTPVPQPVPSTLVVSAGMLIQVRTNEWLSTDRNFPGDGFHATLAQPIVVDGWVVARRGQAVLGRVTQVQKAKGSNHNTSELGLQLSELTFVDGQLLPIQTELSQSATGPDRGQQVGTVAGTTGAGALLGAILGRGPGAAIGAGIGAIAGLGIITNTGRPTVVPPESLLTFRLDAPVTISTVNSPLAFRPVSSVDYNGALNNRPALNRRYGAYPPPPPPPYYGSPYGPYYPAWGYYPPVALGFGYGWGWGYPRYYGRFR